MAGTEHVMYGHWNCSACGRESIPEQDTLCPRCGDPRDTRPVATYPDADIPSKPVQRFESFNPDHWRCIYCNTGNSQTLERCRGCRRFRDEAEETGEALWKPWDINRMFKSLSAIDGSIKLLLLGIAVVLGGYFYWIWGQRSHGVTGRVVAQNWSHTIHLARWQPVQSGDWAPVEPREQEVPPVAGQGGVGSIDITSCYQKHSHYEQYQCGTTTELSREPCDWNRRQNDPHCTELKTREVPKYCQQSIEREWCDFNTQAWVRDELRSATLEGTDAATMQWPDVKPQGDLEKISKTGHWSVDIAFKHRGESRTHSVYFHDSAELVDWPVGGDVTLKVENRGLVRSARSGSAMRYQN